MSVRLTAQGVARVYPTGVKWLISEGLVHVKDADNKVLATYRDWDGVEFVNNDTAENAKILFNNASTQIRESIDIEKIVAGIHKAARKL